MSFGGEVFLYSVGSLIAFSIWDKNSRFFVILAAIGVYSVYGSLSVRISLRRMELAAKKLCEIRRKQFTRSIDIRRERFSFNEEIFIPVKERGFEEHIFTAYNDFPQTA